MSDLTPQPISSFVEITNLNNFNNDSTLTLLNANAATPATKNANLKFKNLYTLVKSNLNLTDADINTGINPANINTNQLVNISSITVNQYGRVVQLAGTNAAVVPTATGVASGFLPSSITVPLNSPANTPVYGTPSTFTTGYAGNILVTVYFNMLTIVPLASQPEITNPPNIYIKNNINTPTQIIPFFKSSSYGANIGKNREYIISGVAVALLPCQPNTTNWVVGVTYEALNPSYTFNYAAVFQNNSQ
jgi:hypothetical protein